MTASKQNKPVDAPIDNRETFVSLSNTMNDSDVSMEQKLRTLYKIQQADIRLDHIYLLRGELPEEVKDLEDEIQGLKTRVNNITNDIKETEKFIAQKKIDLQSAKDAVAKYENQRANVKNSREYDSLSKEIEFQELEQELAQKRIKENTAVIEEKKAYLQATKEKIEGRERDLVNKKAELVSIIDETSKEEEVIKAELAELKKTLEPRMVAAYEKVRSNARNRLAVVTVKRGACGGCFNKIPPQRILDIAMNKKIIVCEYCGRILVSSEFEEE